MDYSKLSTDELLQMYQQQQAAPAEDLSKVSTEDLLARYQQQNVGYAEDMAKAGGSGLLRGAANFVGTGGDISQAMQQGMAPGGIAEQATGGTRQEAVNAMPSWMRRFHEPNKPVVGTSKDVQGAIDAAAGAPVTQYKGQTLPGQLTGGAGEALGNPISYMGPGGAALKIGGAALSGAGGEAGRQATKGTKYEPYGGIAGALLGGAVAGKALGPATPRAAIPKAEELRAAADAGYDAARASGLMVDPRGVAQWAANAQQQLYAKSYSAGKNGTAPQTFAVLDDLQRAPAGAVGAGPANLDAIRKKLRSISEQVQPTAGGAFKYTEDAGAAQKALRHFNGFTENIPQRHIMAGDAASYVRNTKQANSDYAAYSRLRDYDARLTKAERATDRQIAGSLDAQIRQKAGQIIDRGTPGMNAAERAQLSKIERGGPVSNTFRQLGRAGAGVVPLGMQAVTAAATGGTLLPWQIALQAGLYGARKGSEAVTKSRAKKLGEMLAKRSPEYEKRVAGLPPPPGKEANIAALVRAMMTAPR
jgi:hypothetical protein